MKEKLVVEEDKKRKRDDRKGGDGEDAENTKRKAGE